MSNMIRVGCCATITDVAGVGTAEWYAQGTAQRYAPKSEEAEVYPRVPGRPAVALL